MSLQKPAFSIYNASAGSGKTYTLVKEYLKIILTSNKVDAYRTILAITFTNKAVHEMKSRIVDSLFDFTKDTISEKSLALMQDISIDTGLSLHEITTKAKAIIKNIIHNYAAFDISTIDKFTHKVIRSFAIDLNLPINFEVSLDTESLLQEAVDAIVAEAGNDEELTKLLIDFTMEKTDDDKSWDISTEIFNTGKLILNENNRNEVLALKEKSIPQFINLQKRLKELCKDLELQTQTLATEILASLEAKNIDLKSFKGGYFPKHLLSIQEGKFNPNNKTYHEFEDIAINKTAPDTFLIESLIPELLGSLAIIYEKFQKKNFYEAFLKNITPLSLLNTVSNQLAKIQEEQNILSISEFNKLIHEHIQNQPAPFIYERLGERYRHFFVDEFQDTSEMQWQNLVPLIDNALSSEDLQGERGSLLIVGDPKQSIYRWRGGKTEQFIDLIHDANPFSNQDKKVFNLESNYRSHEEIIHFNNAFFKYLSGKLQQKEYRDLYENKSFQKTNTKKGGFVEILFLSDIQKEQTEEEKTSDDLYLLKTLETIHRVQKQGFTLGEMVILVRNNSKGVLLANYLTENKIPVVSSESLLLDSSPEVRLIVYLLRYLNDKKDIESLAHSLYYFSKNFDVHKTTHDFIWEGIQNKTEESLELWLQKFGISLYFRALRRKSLYEIVEYLFLKAIPQEQNNAYTQFFLDIVLERDIKNQISIGDFLEYWDKNKHKLSIHTSENNEAIRIMTIHKSKGLEFPVVIFPFAEENYSTNKREKMWLNSPDEELEFDQFLIDKSSKINDYGQDAQNVFAQKKQEDLLDNINVLYVALTRAEEQLYVISSWKEPNAKGELPNNLTSYFREFCQYHAGFDADGKRFALGSPERISAKSIVLAPNRTIKPITSAVNESSIKIAQREALMWGSLQLEAISFGNVMHEILAFVKTRKDVDFALQKALEEGLIAENQKEVVFQKLNEIVNHPQLMEFFDTEGKIFSERSMVKSGAKINIPDRVVVRNSEAFLLDYKTGLPNPKYTQQVSEYADVLEAMGYRVLKKALVYIGETIEIVTL